MNELKDHVKGLDVIYIQAFATLGRSKKHRVCGGSHTLEGTWDKVQELEDYLLTFDDVEIIEGCIWYADGSWSERLRDEDGVYWWEHRKCPVLPDGWTGSAEDLETK